MADTYVWQFATGVSEARKESTVFVIKAAVKATFGVVSRCACAYDYLAGVVDTAYQFVNKSIRQRIWLTDLFVERDR
jgi:hypothetical protein